MNLKLSIKYKALNMILKLSIKCKLDNLYALYINFLLNFELEFYSRVNTMKVMSSQSVYLTTLLMGRLSPLSG